MMYTLTVKIAAIGTPYIDPDDPHSSPGHMWYSISDGGSTESYGFAPKKSGVPIGDGTVTSNDDKYYAYTYYTGTIVITQDQYETLQAFGDKGNLNGNPYYFDTHYNFATNSCIDYAWKALHYAEFNPGDFDGGFLPADNAPFVDEIFYEALMGSTEGWDASLPDAGDYHAIYGSSGNDTLNAITKDRVDGHNSSTNAIYGGAGNDVLVGNQYNNYLDGGTGSDTLAGGKGYDVYIADNGDTIQDIDRGVGGGEVYFEGTHLTHGVKVCTNGDDASDAGIYMGDGGIYVWSADNKLTFTKKLADGSIQNLSSSSLFLAKSNIKNRKPDAFLICFSKQKERGLRNSLCSNSPRPSSSLFSLKTGNTYAYTREVA